MTITSPLTKCRAVLLKALKDFSPIPVKVTGDSTLHPARLYGEFRLTGPKTRPTIENRFTLYILIIAIPDATTNAYQYIDIANQFHDYLERLALTIPAVGCLRQDGKLNVEDYGYVDKAETIKQATVICDLLLEN